MSGYGFTSAGTSYDDEDRFTGSARASGTFTQSWNLTKVGDWTSVTTNGTAQNRTNELLTACGQSLETDPKGIITLLPLNLTPQSSPLALQWDFDNKLKGADLGNNSSVDVNFQYNALGRRIARTGTGGSVVYVQHDQQTIADYPVGGIATTPTYRYVYASYIDEPVVRKAAGTSGTIHYYHRNQQYSITAMTTSTGAVAERYTYTAYGQPTILNASGTVLTSSAVGNRYTYTGREWDETLGLHHFRARWMSPLAGRFLGRDPIGYVDGENLFECYFAMFGLDYFGTHCTSAACVQRCQSLPEIEISTGSTGVPVTSHPRQACISKCKDAEKNFNDWYANETKNGLPDYSSLPACPCAIGCWRTVRCAYVEQDLGYYGPCAPSGFYLAPQIAYPFYLQRYHPGASWDLRSNGSPSQQCTYDENFKLIETGAGVGTVDKSNSWPYLIGNHKEDDVTPVDWVLILQGEPLSRGCWFNMYLKVRPANGGKACQDYGYKSI